MSLSNLEKILKLKNPFSDEYYKAVVGVIYIENLIFADLENHLKQFNITFQQFNLLRILKGQFPTPTNLNLLKDRMLHKNSDISRMVERLVKQELLYKIENEKNKRKLNIQLTEKGLELINQISLSDPKFKSLTPKLNESEIRTMNLLIDKLLQEENSMTIIEEKI